MANNATQGRPEGGNLPQKVANDRKKPQKINPEFTQISLRYKPLPANVKSFRCCACGNEWTTQRGNFLSGGKSPLWRANGGYLPVCKSCCEAFMAELVSFYGGNEEHALRHLCHTFDWYYDEAASAMTLAQVHHGNSRVTLYPSKMCTRQVANRGETFLDTVRDEFDEDQRIQSAATLPASDDESEDFQVTREIIRRWSTGMSPSEYEFLESEYLDWCNKVEVKSKSQEELIKAICLAQLNVRRAQSAGNNKSVAESMKALTDLMANCNLTPRQASEIANSSSTQMCLGQLIKRIEDEDPIPEPQEEFKDPDGIRKYLSTFFFGHLAKALHIKNDDQEAYDAEIAKYTVTAPRDNAGVENIEDLFSPNENKDADDEN